MRRRCFPAVLLDLMLDLVPLVERAKSSTFGCRDVNKDISAPALRLNKSIAFGRIEPFDAACRHSRSPASRSTISRSGGAPPLSAKGRIAGYRIGGDHAQV